MTLNPQALAQSSFVSPRLAADVGFTMDFVSTGMFVLDDIHIDGRRIEGIIGGAGIYAVLGAGLFLRQERRRAVGMIIDEGHDMPAGQRSEMESWGLGLVFRRSEFRQTTRGLNIYGENEERYFEYLTPSLRIQPSDLTERPDYACAKVVHLICSPLRCIEFSDALSEYHKRLPAGHKQILIWEPVPFDVSPEAWADTVRAFANVDVLSPNAKEAAMFFGLSEPKTKDAIEGIARRFTEFKGLLVIRCGAMGCLAVDAGNYMWYPAYHQEGSRVVDPTGGGNGFLGGLGEGLASADLPTALVYANVAAGLMIEQTGLPKYNSNNDTWNGTKISDRVTIYKRGLAN